MSVIESLHDRLSQLAIDGRKAVESRFPGVYLGIGDIKRPSVSVIVPPVNDDDLAGSKGPVHGRYELQLVDIAMQHLKAVRIVHPVPCRSQNT